MYVFFPARTRWTKGNTQALAGDSFMCVVHVVCDVGEKVCCSGVLVCYANPFIATIGGIFRVLLEG